MIENRVLHDGFYSSGKLRFPRHVEAVNRLTKFRQLELYLIQNFRTVHCVPYTGIVSKRQVGGWT